METIYTMIARFYTGMYERDENEDVGAGLVEYALLVVLIALVAIAGVRALGVDILGIFNRAATETP